MPRIVFLAMLIGMAIPNVSAQDDGRANVSQADRVVLYCRISSVEVWGVSDLSVGLELGEFSYSELLQPGMTVLNTSNGQVAVDATTDGAVHAQWIGGPYGATGQGDFLVRVMCPVPSVIYAAAPVDTTMDTTTTTADTTTTIPTTTTVVDTSTTTTTTTTAASCNYTRTHTVSAGENLFRIGLRYGVPYQTLATCNGIADATRIYVGQQIAVP